MSVSYIETGLSRTDLEAATGPVVVEFGATWCGHCQAAGPMIAAVLAEYSQVKYLQIEDGPGRALGRSFKVKLWPTLIFMCNGEEVGRLVRPTNISTVEEAFERLVVEG